MSEGTLDQVLAGEAAWCIRHGNCRELMAALPDNSIDFIGTDPPYHLTQASRKGSPRKNDKASPFGRHALGERGFMGRSWDGGDVAFDPETWREALRVAKHGAHLMAFGGSRTYHRLACAIEDAGWEIRDSILVFCHGEGFPKGTPQLKGTGLQTALKPSIEPIVLARKPFKGTVLENVKRWGTGALNVDACRVAHAGAADLAAHVAQVEAIKARGGAMDGSWKNSSDLSGASDVNTAGRWPTNLLLQHAPECRRIGASSVTDWECVDGCPVRELAAQSGETSTHGGPVTSEMSGMGFGGGTGSARPVIPSTGTAARYFPQFEWTELDDLTPFLYSAKPSSSETEMGLDHFRRRKQNHEGEPEDGSGVRNPHPTKKSIELCRWLVRLGVPRNGVAFDPFGGTMPMGVAALLEGVRFIGFELHDDDAEPYASIGRARLHYVEGREFKPRPSLLTADPPKQRALFSLGEGVGAGARAQGDSP